MAGRNLDSIVYATQKNFKTLDNTIHWYMNIHYTMIERIPFRNLN